MLPRRLQPRDAKELPGSVTALIVWYDEPPEMIRAGIDSLQSQSAPPREVLIFDDGPTAQVELLERSVRSIGSRADQGYFTGISRAIAACSTEYLLVQNPDCRAEPGCLPTLVAAADADERIAIAGAQIMLGDGLRVNAGDNPLHPTGISYSGRYGEPPEHGPPRDVASSSGACWLVRRSAFEALGGLIDEQFLYYGEDVDLAWRALIAGMRVVFCPEAFALHDYEFSRRPHKLFMLERNRLFSVLCNYERRTLALLAPLLVLSELGIIAGSALQGWLPAKLKAYWSLVLWRRRLATHRRMVQSTRVRPDREVLELFSDRLGTPLIPGPAQAVANAFCVPYMRAVRLFL
jgi:GT2 family glycosyltransferase